MPGNPTAYSKLTTTPTSYTKLGTTPTLWTLEDDDPSSGALLLQDSTALLLQNGQIMGLQLQ